MRNINTKPVLRFPEFKEDWDFFYGNELFEPISNKNHNSDLPILAISQEFGAVPRDLINYQISVTDKSVSSYKVVEKGDFIISLRSFQGGIEYSEYKGICSPAYIILRPKRNIQDYFFKYYLKTFRYIQHLQSKLEGIRDGKMVSYKYFSEIKLPYPSLEEQKKIADFLIQIDNRIAQLKEKKEHLEQYKKGITQKIFSQKLRFKDENGKDFPAWKYLNGNKLFEPISNKNHNSDLPILAISQEFGAVPREMINYHISVTEKSVDSYKVVEKGDFIISLRSFQGGIEYSEYKGICSPAYIILRPKVEISDYFFKTYFKTNNYIQELCRKLEGIRDGKMISYKYFSEIKLPFPQIKEQEKIASFLNEISQQISLVNEQLEETRTFKKALLSKMFC